MVKYDDKELDDIHEFLARGGDPEEAEQGHLSVQELTVFREGELSSEEAKRIEDHLSSCPACSDLLREIEEFFQPAAMGSEGATGNGGTAAEWREVYSRLDREGWFRPVAPGARRESQAAPPQRAGRSRPVSWRRWAPALAAVLTLAVVGIYFVYQPDRPFTTLDPLGSTRGGPPAEAVPLSHDLVLRMESDRAYEVYRAEFLEPSTGRLVTEVPGLKGNQLSEVLVRIPRSLGPGEYEIHLFGIPKGEGPVGTYSVELLDR